MSGWFRLFESFASDSRVQMLSEADQRRLVMVLCIDCKYQKSLIADADMAWRLRITKDEWEQTKRTLVAHGLIDEQNKPTYDGAVVPALRPSAKDWREIRNRIFERDDYTCVYCHKRGGRLQCDHVVPVTRGGDHSDDNLVTSCEACNRAKRDKIVTIEEWRQFRRNAS